MRDHRHRDAGEALRKHSGIAESLCDPRFGCPGNEQGIPHRCRANSQKVLLSALRADCFRIDIRPFRAVLGTVFVVALDALSDQLSEKLRDLAEV